MQPKDLSCLYWSGSRVAVGSTVHVLLCPHLLPVCDDHFLWTLSLSLSLSPVVGGVQNVEKQVPVWFCSHSYSHVGCMIL